jgi:hypothetical protein
MSQSDGTTSPLRGSSAGAWLRQEAQQDVLDLCCQYWCIFLSVPCTMMYHSQQSVTLQSSRGWQQRKPNAGATAGLQILLRDTSGSTVALAGHGLAGTTTCFKLPCPACVPAHPVHPVLSCTALSGTTSCWVYFCMRCCSAICGICNARRCASCTSHLPASCRFDGHKDYVRAAAFNPASEGIWATGRVADGGCCTPNIQ